MHVHIRKSNQIFHIGLSAGPSTLTSWFLFFFFVIIFPFITLPHRIFLSQIFIGEVSMYVMKSTREALLAQEKTIVTGDCCYLNPLTRRIVRFIGKKREDPTRTAGQLDRAKRLNTRHPPGGAGGRGLVWVRSLM